MPELPEVQTTVNGISPLVTNRFITKISIHNDKCRLKPDCRLNQTVNHKILKVSRKFKYVVIEVENSGYIVIHLGMSGNLKVVDDKLPILKHDHVEIFFDNGTVLRYNDHRRFGGVEYTDSLEDFKYFQDQGVDALDDAFNGQYLKNKLAKRKVPIKSLLMDNKVVNGVGNIYANESLYAVGINPLTFPEDITDKEYDELVDTIKNILYQSIAKGGTTLKDFQQPDGKPGYFAQELQCYGKEGEYNAQFNDYYLRIALGGRSTYMLLAKQPLRKSSIAKYKLELEKLHEQITNKTTSKANKVN